jgi:septum formation topological specificity factor MinE
VKITSLYNLDYTAALKTDIMEVLNKEFKISPWKMFILISFLTYEIVMSGIEIMVDLLIACLLTLD